MASIPSTGSLIATHDYYRSEWGVACLPLYCIHLSGWYLNVFDEISLSWSSSVLLSQDESAPPPVTAPVAARSTRGRSFHTTQVRDRTTCPFQFKMWKQRHHLILKPCCSLQVFQGKTPATGGLRFSLQSRTSRACRADLRVRSECPDAATLSVCLVPVWFFSFVG